jgi:hypothetical protein
MTIYERPSLVLKFPLKRAVSSLEYDILIGRSIMK